MSTRAVVRPRPAVPWMVAAAAVGFGTVSLYMVVWGTFATGSSCRPVAAGDCMGGPLAMVLVGLPVLWAVWAVGLRVCGARYPWSAPPAIGLALFVLARIVGPYETPLLVWPVVAAVLSALWRWRFSPRP